jgi:hypothetical protein
MSNINEQMILTKNIIRTYFDRALKIKAFDNETKNIQLFYSITIYRIIIW